MSKVWARDRDSITGDIEDAFTATLGQYLHHVHRDAHLTLGLPAVPREVVQQAHPTQPLGKMAKADGINTAQRLFEELRATPKRVREAGRMAALLAQSWFERGHLESETERHIVEANARGVMMAVSPSRPATIADPDDLDWRAIHYAQEHACIHVRKLRDSTRSTLAAAVTDALIRGDSPQQLAQDLVHRFGTLNRDARRLAITEIAFARNNGFLSAVPLGEQVEVFTAKDCCAACERLTGKRYTVVKGPGNPETEVWVGKHNIGLPASERTAALPFHPHCRCRWVRAEQPQDAGVSERVKAILSSLA